MKHSTNYKNALILPAEDCKAKESVVPTRPGTVGALQHDLLIAKPYALTSDDLLVAVTGTRKEIPEDEWDDLRAEIFSKGQPCLRASPLVKTLGWAVHHDADQKVGLVAVGSALYEALIKDERVTKLLGMRSKRA